MNIWQQIARVHTINIHVHKKRKEQNEIRKWDLFDVMRNQNTYEQVVYDWGISSVDTMSAPFDWLLSPLVDFVFDFRENKDGCRFNFEWSF